MGVYSKVFFPVDPLTGARPVGYVRNGYTGDKITPLQYDGYGGCTFPHRIDLPNGAYLSQDVPNTDPIYRLANTDFGEAAANAAWAKLVGKVRSGPASLGTSAAEGREALAMVASRCGQLFTGANHLLHGRFRKFLNTFGISAKRKHRNKIKNSINEMSSLWLEYSFGWSPLFSDIYDAMTVLQKPLPAFSFVGRGKEEWLWKAGTKVNFGFIHVKQGADCFVSDPNLYLLQELGIANPAQIAWELFPYGFVVDWVFDVSSFLGSFTDFLGVEVLRSYTTRFIATEGSQEWDYTFLGWQVYKQRLTTYVVRRRPGLTRPTPNTHFTRNIGTSLKRAANAASLLGQILSKG